MGGGIVPAGSGWGITWVQNMSHKNDYARGGTTRAKSNRRDLPRPKHTGFFRKFQWITDSSTIDANEAHLLTALLRVCDNDTGVTEKSIRWIATKAHRSTRWVHHHLARLVARGFVRRVRRHWRTSILTLVLPLQSELHGAHTFYPTNTPEVCIPSESVRNCRTPSHESGEYSSVEGVGWPEGMRQESPVSFEVCAGMREDGRICAAPIPQWKKREYLHAAGVRGSTLDRLSRHPAITAERVLAEVHEIKMKPHGIRDRVRVLIHRLQVAAGVQPRQRQGSDLVRAASSDPALDRLRSIVAARSASTTAWVRPS